MTRFLDVRLSNSGGDLASTVAAFQGTAIHDYSGLQMGDLLGYVWDRHVLIITHGFNMNRAMGIACLSNFESLLTLPAGSAVLGMLWPSDSVWMRGLDYPGETKVADDAGAMLARFVDANFQGVASVSFVSHSLGARVALSAIKSLKMAVRRLILMAGAIDDDCLNTEFASAAAKVESISMLASRKDTVLSQLFPLGWLSAKGIVGKGHPWWHSALGQTGPADPRPTNFQAPCQIPDNWNFDHGGYLQITAPPQPALAVPTGVPPNGSRLPAEGAPGWQQAFCAAFVSTRFR
jgi:hypothetical protein